MRRPGWKSPSEGWLKIIAQYRAELEAAAAREVELRERMDKLELLVLRLAAQCDGAEKTGTEQNS